MPLGEALHSYLNPYNPGAGELTAETLARTGIAMENLEGLGWHIHPGVPQDGPRAAAKESMCPART